MLLPVYSHTRDGIMRAEWSGHIATIPNFVPEQAAAIRSRLSAAN